MKKNYVEPNKYKIALIVGHNVVGRDQGAINYLGESESSFNYRIANKVYEKLKGCNKFIPYVFIRDGIGILGVAEDVANFGSDLSIEFHFNSFEGKAYGCEALALDGDHASTDFADIVTDVLAQDLELTQRHLNGVLLLNPLDRGYKNLIAIKEKENFESVKIIIEPCFANRETPESKRIFEHEDDYVDAVVKAIKIHFGVEKFKRSTMFTVNEFYRNEITLNPLKAIYKIFDSWRGY